MFDGLSTAISILADRQVIFFILLGSGIGLVLGVLPGLGAIQGMVLTMPFVYGLDPKSAMYFFISMMGASPVGGSITAILINIPGTAVNAATCFDGYPMSKKGEAGKAVGIAAIASGLGAFFSIFWLIVLLGLVRPILMAFGPPEFFMMVFFGLLMVAVATRGNLIKGLAAAGVGILISLIGFGPATGVLRFDLGLRNYFWDSVQLVPFITGIFCFGEVISHATRGGTISQQADMAVKGLIKEALSGAREIFRYYKCFLRSSSIGTIIGIIPGIGGAVSNLFAYVVAVQTSKTPEKFGTGHPEGVVAPEAANNATVGGALVPLLSFGIPGSVETAVLLGILIVFGIAPGPRFLLEHSDIVWSLIVGLFIANAIASIVGLVSARYLAKVTRIPVHYIVSVILPLGALGIYALRENVWDVVLGVVAGIIGWSMTRFGFPIVALIMGFILGGLCENSFLQSLQMSYGSYAIFFTRPISLGLLIMAIFITGFALFRSGRREEIAK
jgi:putative tricarboxylic transport membrane protein